MPRARRTENDVGNRHCVGNGTRLCDRTERGMAQHGIPCASIAYDPRRTIVAYVSTGHRIGPAEDHRGQLPARLAPSSRCPSPPGTNRR
eukprot:1013829-Rhodomonas_salina.3